METRDPHVDALQQLHLAEQRYDRYAAKVSASIQETRSLCQFINTEGQENVENLKERLQRLNLEHKAQADKIQESSALQELIKLLDNRTQELGRSIVELSDIEKRQEELIEAQLAEVEVSLQEKKKKNDLMLESIFWFERNLGFRVQETKNNGLRIILKKVLDTDLEREFDFSIRHDKGSNVYTLLECNPEMDGTKDLLNELNQTNDLKRFISKMRNLFRKGIVN